MQRRDRYKQSEKVQLKRERKREREREREDERRERKQVDRGSTLAASQLERSRRVMQQNNHTASHR